MKTTERRLNKLRLKIGRRLTGRASDYWDQVADDGDRDEIAEIADKMGLEAALEHICELAASMDYPLATADRALHPPPTQTPHGARRN